MSKEKIPGKTELYLWGIITYGLPFLTILGMIFYNNLYGSGSPSAVILNPLTLLWLAANIFVPVLIVSTRLRAVETYRQYINDENGDRAQKSVSKVSTLVIVMILLVNIGFPQLLLLSLKGITTDIRWGMAGVSYAATLLAGTPAYILMLRKVEAFCHFLPLDQKHLSLSFIARNALVLFFSLSGVTVLFFVSVNRIVHLYTGPIEAMFVWILAKTGPIAILGTLIGILTNILLAKGIDTRIRIMNRFVNDLAEGNLATDSIRILSRDEIGLLFKDLNRVQISLKEIIYSIRKSTEDMIAIKDMLIRISHETSSTTTQIAANIESVNRQINSLDDSMGGSTQAVSSMTENLGNLGDQIGDQAAMVEESSAAITEMIASIESISGIARRKVQATESLLSVSDEGGEKLGTTLTTLKTINASIENIKEITSIIMGIAARTNLLAMNAAIEAAHAGDAGRGFSVVADEIRKLAETSSKSSKRINDTIKEIVSQIEESSRSAEGTMSTFQSVKKEVDEVVQSFKEIERGLSELKAGSSQILQASTGLQSISLSVRDSTEEMLKQTGGVSESVHLVARISSETRGAAGEISNGTNEILKVIGELGNHAAELDRYSDLLRQNVGKFRI